MLVKILGAALGAVVVTEAVTFNADTITGRVQASGKHAPAPTKEEKAPADTLLTPTWVLTRDTPKVGEIVEAWLVVPRYTGTKMDSAATVSLLPPSTAKVWLRTNAGCAESEGNNLQSTMGAVPRDTILFACVRPTTEGVLRLVAVRRALEGAGSVAAQRIAVSDPITVSARFEVTATLVAALSAIGGLLAGFLGHVLQDRYDKSRADKRSVIEMQGVVLAALVPEFKRNRESLEGFLPAGTTKAPDLVAGGYNTVLGDKGVASFLKEDDRKTYFAGVEKIYDAINDYTDAKGNQADAATMFRAAQRVMDLLPPTTTPTA